MNDFLLTDVQYNIYTILLYFLVLLNYNLNSLTKILRYSLNLSEDGKGTQRKALAAKVPPKIFVDSSSGYTERSNTLDRTHRRNKARYIVLPFTLLYT